MPASRPKRLRWMLTIWCEPLPSFIRHMDSLHVCHLQKEITKAGKIHWQAFAQFLEPQTVPAVKAFFDKHGLKNRVRVGGKDITEVYKTPVKGLRYVHGYGPLALSKLLESDMRYIITPDRILQMPVTEDRLDEWRKLSFRTRAIGLERKNQEMNNEVLRQMLKKTEKSPFFIKNIDTRQMITESLKNFEEELS